MASLGQIFVLEKSYSNHSFSLLAFYPYFVYMNNIFYGHDKCLHLSNTELLNSFSNNLMYHNIILIASFLLHIYFLQSNSGCTVNYYIKYIYNIYTRSLDLRVRPLAPPPKRILLIVRMWQQFKGSQEAKSKKALNRTSRIFPNFQNQKESRKSDNQKYALGGGD